MTNKQNINQNLEIMENLNIKNICKDYFIVTLDNLEIAENEECHFEVINEVGTWDIYDRRTKGSMGVHSLPKIKASTKKEAIEWITNR